MGVTLYSRIPAIVGAMPSKANAVVQKTAADIEASAKGAAPVDTGALRSSVQARSLGMMRAEVATGLEYSIYVEYGTSKMAAQPYLVPAAHQNFAPFIAAMKQVAW